MPCELKMIVAKRQIQKGEWHTDTCESSTPMLVVLMLLDFHTDTEVIVNLGKKQNGMMRDHAESLAASLSTQVQEKVVFTLPPRVRNWNGKAPIVTSFFKHLDEDMCSNTLEKLFEVCNRVIETYEGGNLSLDDIDVVQKAKKEIVGLIESGIVPFQSKKCCHGRFLSMEQKYFGEEPQMKLCT